MKTIQLTIAVVAMLFALTGEASKRSLQALEEAAEVSELALSGSASQTLYARICDNCPIRSLRIGPNTRFYEGRSRIDAATAARLSGRGATVFFDPDTQKVSRIVFWRSAK